MRSETSLSFEKNTGDCASSIRKGLAGGWVGRRSRAERDGSPNQTPSQSWDRGWTDDGWGRRLRAPDDLVREKWRNSVKRGKNLKMVREHRR